MVHAAPERRVEDLSHHELLERHNAERDRANAAEAKLLNGQGSTSELEAKHAAALATLQAEHAAQLEALTAPPAPAAQEPPAAPEPEAKGDETKTGSRRNSRGS